MPSSANKFSLLKLLFADRMILPLIIGWFCLDFSTIIPLLLNNAFGEDPSGYCGAKKFTSLLLLSWYLSTAVLAFFIGLVLTVFYYYRLARFLKTHLNNSSENSVNYTRAIMRLMKIVILIPVFLASPAIMLTGGQMFLPELPMWIKRLIVVPYFLSAAATPWLTISLLKPFRRRFINFLEKISKVVTITTMTPGE
jgi:hypothetical protein